MSPREGSSVPVELVYIGIPSGCTTAIGGDLVQDLGDGVGALAPKKFFLTSPQNAQFRGTAGDSLSFGNVAQY